MKNLLIIIVLLVFIPFGVSGQQWSGNSPGNIYYNQGKVGIGTSTPLYRLSIRGNSQDKIGFSIFNDTYGNNQGEFFFLKTGNSYVVTSQRSAGVIESYNDLILSAAAGTGKSNPAIKFQTGRGGANSENRMVIDYIGNVGIGEAYPDEKLHINGNLLLDAYNNGGAGNGIFFRGGFGSGDAQPRNLSIRIRGINSPSTPDGLEINAYDGITFSTMETDRMYLLPNGSLGIGTVSTGTHKLAVEGTIGAREVKVETGTWSDFVFKEDYKLRSLNEVENYIQQHKHLPDIPSEEEVLENGIELGKMGAKLLQKIEELTLYIIEQEKKIDSLEATAQKVERLELKVNQLLKLMEDE